MKRSKWLMLVAMLSALSLVAAACGGDDGDDETGGGGDGEQQDCTWVIGTMGALSGDFASLGKPISEGVEYAVNQANEEGELPCELELQSEDSQGDPTQAPALAEKLIGTENLIFCACPYFSGETLATGAIFGSAGVAISGTGTNETIDEQDPPFETWHRAVAPDNIQAEVAAEYISSLTDGTVAVVHDNQDYSKGLADAVAENLGDAAEGPFIINPEEPDFSAVVSQVKNANPEVVFYGGYTPEAGPLLKQLREAGVDATFVSDDGSKDPTFGELAGEENAEGALVTCPCADPLKIDAAAEFVEGMRAEFGENAPGTFAADVYDVTRMVIEGLKDYDGDVEDYTALRAEVVSIFDKANYEGVAKTYSWEESGEFVGGPEDIWIYEWSNKDGNFVSLGPASDLIE
ncbi:MAG TPA: branched-chain amino acid ABC transporter substrate-binding protein [Actinomycetota bacterium]|nr:branched-chain amino acid ABC transporter substrate-binding protein [Actinomycetota bacterium]